MKVISITQTGNLGTKRRSVKPEFKMGSVSIKFLTIIIFSVLAIFYLVQSQLSANKRQEIKKYQDIQQELTSESETLELQANNLKSINSIESTASAMQMSQAENILYANNLPENQLSQK